MAAYAAMTKNEGYFRRETGSLPSAFASSWSQAELECFRKSGGPVFQSEARRNKELEPFRDSIKIGKALGVACNVCRFSHVMAA